MLQSVNDYQIFMEVLQNVAPVLVEMQEVLGTNETDHKQIENFKAETKSTFIRLMECSVWGKGIGRSGIKVRKHRKEG